ncbi:hypothetical protein J2TS6_29940 [Paenibacillus albilobatus]|uniref:Uncharacterized protein n=1 Tax=Paenibacillus albilobatus TaxID=2716884 RepID=A0A919XI77_9BACL|nr:hypothetical protein J2TS6_29940 [Paenibacillus albilobatus]
MPFRASKVFEKGGVQAEMILKKPASGGSRFVRVDVSLYRKVEFSR